MDQSPFVDYALSGKLSDDETYTVELLIDHVRWKFDATYWDTCSEADDAREGKGYRPRFAQEHVVPAARELEKLTWLSLQRTNTARRPLRNLQAIGLLPNITALVLIDNDISDLSPLQSCHRLQKLMLKGNPLRDLSALRGCQLLEELELKNIPCADLRPLAALPRLRTLSLDTNQIEALRQVPCLPALETLKFAGESFDSFCGLPEMRRLCAIQGAEVQSLEGLEAYPQLLSLVNLSGDFDALAPLRSLKQLTHVNIFKSRVADLEPLAGLSQLRAFRLSTAAKKLDLSPLERLPLLHEVAITCAGKEPPQLAKLRANLPSWDIEFRAARPRYVPSLEMEVVDDATFDRFDSEEWYGVTADDTNEEMLLSELDWLDDQLEQVLAVEFEEHEDYEIPYQYRLARSRTIALSSQRSMAAFARIVLRIQMVLCQARRDWIVYFQSAGVEPEFIVWVYPQKIQVTAKYADAVRQLIALHGP